MLETQRQPLQFALPKTLSISLQFEMLANILQKNQPKILVVSFLPLLLIFQTCLPWAETKYHHNYTNKKVKCQLNFFAIEAVINYICAG